MKPSGPGLLFVGGFLITDSIFTTSNMSVLIFCFFLNHSWKIVCLQIYVFLLGCPFFLDMICLILWFFVFLFYCIGLKFSFISGYIYLGPLSFFLDDLAKGLFLFTFSKNQLLVSLIFSIFSVFIYFCSGLYYFLLSDDFRLCFSSSDSFRW